MAQVKSEFLNIMLERGFYNQCTNLEGFDAYLYECEQKGVPAVGYLGSDPTGDSLHVGHIVPLMMMCWFQKCGHKPLTLVGGATARIAFSTDSFVVSPHFFPGGDIGRLAICGTVNDIATSGAVPLCSAGPAPRTKLRLLRKEFFPT